VAIVAVLIGLRLSEPEMMYFDEVYFVPSARDLLSGNGLGEVTHPPLAKELMALSIWLFGDSPLSWRLPSMASGSALVGIIFMLMRVLGASRAAAVVCAVLVAVDGLCLTQARVGTLNAPSVAFGCGALLCALRGRPFVAGALLGGATACKFIGLGFLPLVVWCLFRESADRCGRYEAVKVVLKSSAIAMLIYLGALGISGWLGHATLAELMSYQREIFSHHLFDANLPHRYQSPWWTWPLSIRPIWYGYEELGGSGLVRAIFCIANPVSSVVVGLGVVMLLVRILRRQKVSLGESLAVSGYVLQFLPWALSPRTTMYHYYYPALVFGLLLFCLEIDRLRSGWRQGVMVVCTALAIGMFMYWYPLWTALPMSYESYRARVWFKEWI
jgi:dolichyl-phosphate-mannose--protein O-mannosyl transferase